MGDQKRAVMILGERGVSQVIGRVFEKEGILPIRISGQESLPRISDSGSLHRLRALFSDFVSKASNGTKTQQGQYLVHPGVSPWADRPELPIVGEEFNLTVISPTPRTLSFFSNKLNFLLEAEKLGIPNLVLSDEPIHTLREIEEFIRKKNQSFPFILRTVKGGGSAGLYQVHDAGDLGRGLHLWFDQVRRNLGEVILFPERHLEGARYGVVPFARFQSGKMQFFPMVDSSLKCRFRKVLQFSPPTWADENLRDQMQHWTARIAERFGFVGLGALEYLVDGSRAYLVEGLARLDSAFPLWEKVAGVSAVSWQLASLGLISEPPPVSSENEWKSGVNARMFVEDSLLHLPQPGYVHEVTEQTEWIFPDCSEAHLILNYQQGEWVSPFDSGLFGVLVATAKTPQAALRIAAHILNHEFWVSGSLQTNDRFIVELLNHSWIREEVFHAGFIDEEFLIPTHPPVEYVDLTARICAAHFITKDQDGSSIAKVRWIVADQYVRDGNQFSNANIPWIGTPKTFVFGGISGISGTLPLEGDIFRICIFPMQERWLVKLGTWCFSIRKSISQLPRHVGERKRVRLCALVSGRIHAILFLREALVSAHQPLIVLESLGIFVPHALPLTARVVEWKVGPEQSVTCGQQLAELEVVEG